MTIQTQPVRASSAHGSRTAPTDLAALAQLSGEELERLFRRSCMERIDELGENPRGLVIAVSGLNTGLVGQIARRVHARDGFMWEGKSFYPRDASHGTGENRILFPTRRGIFGFKTALTASVVDGLSCLAIDYDVPENPAFVRPIYDEVRSVGNGLYLGRGMMRLRKARPSLALWFALDKKQQDASVR